MTIDLCEVGMRFGKEVLFQNVQRTITEGAHLAILGYNGSGKSTLLQIMAGAMLPTLGKVVFRRNGDLVQDDEQYAYVAFATPYAELIEELSVREIAAFQAGILPNALSSEEIIEMSLLKASADKPISKLSSGMRQRLKISMAIGSGRPWVFLDEPCSNLDEKGVQWYRDLLEGYRTGRTFIICSNHYEKEYHICTEKLNIADHKPNSN
jgi:ABC-type multidrug transport system ATPase subunit